jgi:hypothetical protein
MEPARPPAPSECPHCGSELSPRALACPECGADARAGWSDEPDWAGGLPDGYGDDDAFDDEAYQEFLQREGLADEDAEAPLVIRFKPTAVVAALLLACALLWLVFR